MESISNRGPATEPDSTLKGDEAIAPLEPLLTDDLADNLEDLANLEYSLEEPFGLDEEEFDPDAAILWPPLQEQLEDDQADETLISAFDLAFETGLEEEADLEDQLSDLRRSEQELDFLLPPESALVDDLLSWSELADPTSPLRSAPPRPSETVWYLGIDIGTTGISAVLLNRQTCELHPIYWLEIKFPEAGRGLIAAPEKTYRLPMAVYLNSNGPEALRGGTTTGVAIASLSLGSEAARRGVSDPTALPLQDFKPFLRVGVPYYAPETAHWEPVIQWAAQQPIPLSTLQQALRAMLSTIAYPTGEATDGPMLTSGAVGLDDATFQGALHHLAGVVLNYPANWPDTYTFNLREAVLASRLVTRPEHIYFLEDSIATVLSGLPSGDGREITVPSSLAQTLELNNHTWHGGTLVLTAGASITELAIATLPDHLETLAHRDFTVRSVAYGGHQLDQDIICQIIYPAWIQQELRLTANQPDSGLPVAAEGAQSGAVSDHWNWQPDPTHPNRDPWDCLNWDTVTPPIPGEPDLQNRHALQQRLLSSAAGLSLLDAARHLKLVLQTQDRCILQFGDQQLLITRQDVGSRVLLPYIQRLNRELNTLLSQTGLSVLGVNQVICSGGTASLAAIARWLRQKLPNATILQDTYSLPTSPNPSAYPCSRVAYGLAMLPLHPQVLDIARHQYSDYFLLMELLRTFPDSPITAASLLQILERRGINIQTCQAHILALLEGHLPPGLVPTERDAYLLTPASQHNPDYQALLAAPLFFREAPQVYRPNPPQWQQFRRFLDTLIASSHQKFTEPLAAALERVHP